jgi:hypothetical protein
MPRHALHFTKNRLTANRRTKQSFHLKRSEELALRSPKPYERGFVKGSYVDPVALRKRRKRVRARMNQDSRRKIVELS